jgi:hypothetical protein
MALFEIYMFLCQNCATFNRNISYLGDGHVGFTERFENICAQ